MNSNIRIIYLYIVCFVTLGMIVAGIGTFLCIYMSGLVRAYRLLIMNEAYQQKGK